MDTKQKILDVSLKLFSENGYESVSIRQICGYVKIKESSIYYHFKNKRAILDELINMFEEKANNMMNELEKSLNNIDFNNDSFKSICNIFFEQYLMDDFCNNILRLLAIEQLNNDELQKKYEFWMFEKPLSFQSDVFKILIDLKMINSLDSEYLAIKYYSPIYYFAQRWLLSGKMTNDKKEIFYLNAYKHIRNFFSEIKGEKV